ncbi:MAG: tyrosine--tRNA ligase [Cyanobacteria bacterium J06632_3]
MNRHESIERILQSAVQIYSEDTLKQRLESGDTLRIKLGADPSRPDLHLGHSVVLRVLRCFQDLGHEVVFVVGDYTAMIGDPSGKRKTRPSLTHEETKAAGETYFRQVTKILDKRKTRIEYNSSWLSQLDFRDFLSLASKYTVARILERNDFQQRYSAQQPIGMHELLYPLIQGYDSVALKADIEIGGTDQTFNLLVGRELQRDYDQKPQEVMTFPLLVGTDGVEKMSKSLDNYIGLDEPPERMYEKAMRVPDDVLREYFRLTTDIPLTEADQLISSDVRKAHVRYAEEIVRMYHGESTIEAAAMRYAKVAKGTIPENIPEISVEQSSLEGDQLGLIDALRKAGLASTNSEARRRIQGNGVSVDGQKILDIHYMLELSTPKVVQYGKSKFVRITLA